MAMVVTEILIHSLRPPCLRCAHYIPALPAPSLPEEGNPKVEQMFKHQPSAMFPRLNGSATSSGDPGKRVSNGTVETMLNHKEGQVIYITV